MLGSDMANIIFNESCLDTMGRMQDGQVGVILTSPFYNTNKKAGKSGTLSSAKVGKGYYPHVRYDTHCDNMTTREYSDFTVGLFDEFDRILKKDGVVLYNMSYGASGCDDLICVVHDIINNTQFSLADVIVWKKRNAMPNNCSKNRLTRIWEFVFVFCRKEEQKSFESNKRVVGHRKTGQASYENVFNFVEAKNNDGPCPFNKATYSSELCEKLLGIYAKPGTVVYDPFMGSGTTAVACKKMGLTYVGSEISENQVRYSRERLA